MFVAFENMDVIATENVNVPNSVLVDGLTGEAIDNEVIEYLSQCGLIERVIKVTSSEARFKNTAIVEFASGDPIQYLQRVLPCSRPTSDPNVTNNIQFLSDLYAADKGSTLTQTYLAELKDVAKISGADFEKVLLEELTRIRESTKLPTAAIGTSDTEPQLAGSVTPPALVTSPTQTPVKIVTDVTHSHEHDSLSLPSGAEAAPSTKKPGFYLPSEQLTSAEVQKIVVEHVIRNSDMVSQYHGLTKLRSFSGKTPCPNLESDYDTWRSNVDFCLADPSMSDKLTVRRIVESLLPPAANVVKHLGPNSSPHDYLSLLDSAYGIVDDGDELFAKFLNTNQNSGEKPSSYLQRLQAALSKVVKRGGVAAADSECQLLKQFCRGCWNNNLITSLQLEQKKTNPPSFSKLLLLLRTDEDRQTAKSNRMKQHLGFSKTKVQSNPLSVNDCTTYDVDMAAAASVTPSVDTNKLEQQIAKLQAQVASLKTSLSSNSAQPSPKSTKKTNSKVPTEQKSASPGESTPEKKPRPGYCFRCGQDGHIAPSCSNEPDPEEVERKRKEFRQKQQAWEQQHKHPLN